jgi:hypothetical protein
MIRSVEAEIRSGINLSIFMVIVKDGFLVENLIFVLTKLDKSLGNT